MATLAIFDWPGAVKNACWGASPNPALWDKMSQRDWLRHCRCRVCSLLFCPSISLNRRVMLRPALEEKTGRHCEKHRPSFWTFCPKGSSFNCSVRNYYRDNLQSQQNTLHRPLAQIPGLCLPQNPIVCIQEFYRFQYLR